jgi:hypothetical protein
MKPNLKTSDSSSLKGTDHTQQPWAQIGELARSAQPQTHRYHCLLVTNFYVS